MSRLKVPFFLRIKHCSIASTYLHLANFTKLSVSIGLVSKVSGRTRTLLKRTDFFVSNSLSAMLKSYEPSLITRRFFCMLFTRCKNRTQSQIFVVATDTFVFNFFLQALAESVTSRITAVLSVKSQDYQQDYSKQI